MIFRTGKRHKTKYIANLEKQQQRRRQMDIENMADLDPEDYDEWEDK